MGNFFTSTQIYSSDAAERDKFIDVFCKAMEKEGYIPCDGDEAEKSYILKFADNCNWVTITSESYEQGNQIALSDTGRIAKMLKTSCVNTRVIDSDCAVMEMYSKSGKKADTLIMGRADDYFGDDTLKPSEKAWKPFLAEGMTWEQLCNILNNSEDYTFVEDCLSALAPIIGMDDSNILFSAEDAEEGDKQTVFLGFKKAEAKEKKLTLNAAFKQVFGMALEPLGFKLVKSRYPYFVRVINGEILHIITIKTEQASYPEDKAFTILGGIATVYRPKIDFSVSISNNYNWLRADIGSFYLSTLDKDFYFISDEERILHHSLVRFHYFSEVPKSLPSVMGDALESAKKYMLPKLDNIDTLEKCIAYLEKKTLINKKCFDSKHIYDSYDYDEGFLYLLTDNAKLKEKWRKIVDRETVVSDEAYNRYVQYYRYFNDPVFNKSVLDELERRKAENLEILKGYGIISD